MDLVLSAHVIAGGLAIVSGAVALSVRKGGVIHRRSGMLFVLSMVAMCLTAAALAIHDWPRGIGNLFASVMTLYFVGTALAAVRPQSPVSRGLLIVGMVVAATLGVIDILFGFRALNSPRGTLGGVPFPMFFLLATVLLLGAAGDLRVIRSGALRGGRRLARHLWRMCFALFIAAASFFSIRARVAKVLPAPFTTGLMRALPILLIFVAMFYWLWRVRRDERRAEAARALRVAA